MRRAVVTIVGAGLALAIVIGLTRGFDVLSLVMLALLFALGALAVTVAARAEKGGVQPARCHECGGLISPNAPYCKHCGADQRSDA